MRLLVLGTGAMAAAHARAFSVIPGVTLVAGVDVDKARAADFGKAHGFSKSFTDLDKAIAWGEFDAVTNVTPDAVHHPTTMQCLAAGKPVFCEKPLAQSFPLATRWRRRRKKPSSSTW